MWMNLDCTITHPRSTIGPGRLPGKKKSKQRATFLAFCNSDGSQKFPFLVIGHAQNPRCFSGRNVVGCGMMYRATPKARMNTYLFREWLQNFDSYIGQTANRRAVLLLDNASCHRQIQIDHSSIILKSFSYHLILVVAFSL